jgi:hypothetical protein
MTFVFSPSWPSTFQIANAVASATGVPLPKQSDQILVTNTSVTASVNIMITQYPDESTVPAGTAATLTTGHKVLPNSQVRIFVGEGLKVIRTIATAADGVLEVMSGHGV